MSSGVRFILSIPLSFWEFCSERLNIFHKRWILREEPPWTQDPILSSYYFTNTYRELDRTSLWFIVKVLRQQSQTERIEDLVFSSILLRRCFNRPETYSLILNACDDFGQESTMEISPSEFLKNKNNILLALEKSEFSLFSHAYTLVFKGQSVGIPKYRSLINELMVPLARQSKKYLSPIVKVKTPAECFKAVRNLPSHGQFLSYEVFCDISYCDYFLERWNTDSEQVVASCGPGAVKGLKFIFPDQPAVQEEDLGGFSKDYFWESWIRYLRVEQPVLKNLFEARKLSLRGCEHSACEYSKYMRLWNLQNAGGPMTHQRKFKYDSGRDKDYLEWLNSPEFQSLYTKWRLLSPEGFES